MADYSGFLARKFSCHQAMGVDPEWLNAESLLPHAHALTRWALRKGRAAIFADTGLTKTRMQLCWADAIHRATGVDVLILAPLAVAKQTAMEAESIGIRIKQCNGADDVESGISITNYDRLHRFDTDRFGGNVLDESSIIKHHDAKTLQMLLDAFSDTPYKLCASATPAPNDWTELGTHAEFLGICSRSEMLAEYFTHDGGETQTWRLKGHARQQFWRWMASWGAMVRKPSDLGFDDSDFRLPPLVVEQISVESDQELPQGEMFMRQAQTLTERRKARRDSLRHRVDACADLVNSIDDPWIVWCELNAEGDALKAAIPDAVEIRGNDDRALKERALEDFAAGRIRVLITKPKIAGFGLNWQHCARIGFVGVSDSFEAYYQAVRRCWRFGQKRQVHAYLFVSEQEGAVRANLERKEREAILMWNAMSSETAAAVRDEVLGNARVTNEYAPKKSLVLPNFM